MYSGKTEELIRQIKRCEFAKQKYQVFKPQIDKRYSETEVSSHNQDRIPSIVINEPNEVYQHLKHNTRVVGIDEAQFFEKGIVDVITKLANHGRRVLVAGLDTDWQGLPFGSMPEILAVSDIIHKQYAVCMVCGDAATRTQRLVNSQEDILVGSFNIYEARCREHFDPQLSLRRKFEDQQELNL